MRNFKSFMAVLMTAFVVAGSLAGCGTGTGNNAGNVSGGEEGRSTQREADGHAEKSVQIVTTIFPEYDWVREILGDNPGNAEVTMLLDNGVDLHSYQPTAMDILKISTCDLFIYVGGESDEWVEDALKEATNQNMVVINLLETLGDQAKEEEIVEGMEGEHEEDGAEGAEHEGEAGRESGQGQDGEETEYDEHVWLSLKNASVLCDAIADALADIDTANADTYKANAESYKGQLAALDAEYQSAVAAGSKKTILFGDRFPFRYLVDDYDLSYYAAFAGCSAETEASFETVIFLANKTDELGLSTILTLESSDGRIAETVKNSTAAKDQQILKMNSLQSATTKDVEAGVSYLSIMAENLEVLREALR